MKPVTDPELLAQLNENSGQPVTDPTLLAQLNNEQPDTSMGQVTINAARTAFRGPYDTTKAMLENPEAIRKQAPIAGAILGGPIGAGLGQIASRMGGIAYGTEPPAENVNFSPREAIVPMIQTAVAGLPETPQGKAITNTFKKGYSKAAETLSGLKKDITQTAFKKGVSVYNAPSLPKAQEIFGEALGPTGKAALNETASEAFDPALSKARQIATEIGTKIENGEVVSAVEALQARQATDRIISATSWKDKLARKSLYGWRNRFDNELASQSGALANASRTYRNAIVKDKLLTPTRMNKSGEPSAFLPMLLGAAGPIAGYQSGHTGRGLEAAGLGLAVTSPALWGAGAAIAGTISPTVRKALLSELITRITVGKQGGQ